MNVLFLFLFCSIPLHSEKKVINETAPKIEVIVETSRVKKEKLDIVKLKEPDPRYEVIGPFYVIESKIALGTAGYHYPVDRLRKIALKFDGKLMEFDQSLFLDCFNVGKMQFIVDEANQSVLVYMQGGHASTSYTVIWILSSTGFGTRFINMHSDSGYGLESFGINFN